MKTRYISVQNLSRCLLTDNFPAQARVVLLGFGSYTCYGTFNRRLCIFYAVKHLTPIFVNPVHGNVTFTKACPGMDLSSYKGCKTTTLCFFTKFSFPLVIGRIIHAIKWTFIQLNICAVRFSDE